MVQIVITDVNGFIGQRLCHYLQVHHPDFTIGTEPTGPDDIIFHINDNSANNGPHPLAAIKYNSYELTAMAELARAAKCTLIYLIIEQDRTETAKTLAEDLGMLILRYYSEHYGLSCAVLKCNNIFGPGVPLKGEFANVIGKFIHEYRQQIPLKVHGNINELQGYIHIDDICRASMLIAQIPNITYRPVVTISSGQTYTIAEIIKLFHPYPLNGRDYQDNTLIAIDPHIKGQHQLYQQELGLLAEWQPQHRLSDYIQAIISGLEK